MSSTLWLLPLAVLVVGCTDEEHTATDHEFVVTVTNLTPAESVFASGRFDTPDTQTDPGPIGPNQRFRFEVTVHPGAQLQMITMFLESNDAFLGFAPQGIALWGYDGTPLVGDRTGELVLYDAGTELDQPLGTGDAQPLRQSQPNYGASEHAPVRVIAEAEDGPIKDSSGIEYPGIAEFAELEVVHLDGARFEIILRNVSSEDLLGHPGGGANQADVPALLSPGVFSVHEPGVEWFDIGEPASEPLERLVEDAQSTPLFERMTAMGGVSSPFTGVVWAVHDGETPLCGVGFPASPGLEALVEHGRVSDLLAEIAALEGVRAYGLVDPSNPSPTSYAYMSSVFGAGESVELRFRAGPGDHLGLISGYLATNDKFVGLCGSGVALFDAKDVALSGPLGERLAVYDAGTEVDEPPGLGAHQFERQTGNELGVDEHGLVREVEGWWMDALYPSAAQLLAVDVQANVALDDD